VLIVGLNQSASDGHSVGASGGLRAAAAIAASTASGSTSACGLQEQHREQEENNNRPALPSYLPGHQKRTPQLDRKTEVPITRGGVQSVAVCLVGTVTLMMTSLCLALKLQSRYLARLSPATNCTLYGQVSPNTPAIQSHQSLPARSRRQCKLPIAPGSL